ncbi:MAG: DUF2384 domain-containing protein [Deltaproteobacteria bacterium]
MNDSVVDINQYKYEQAERDIRTKLVEYSERPEIQSQLGEAFYIWRDDPDFLPEEVTEDQVDDLTFEKFFDWFLYDFKLLDTQERVIERYYKKERESLSETEESIVRDWLQNLYSFFEIEEVVEGESCKIRDLFTKEVFTVMDSASSTKVKRSDIIGARPLSTRNRFYFSAVISVYPSTFKNIIIDFFNNEFKEYRKSFGNARTKEQYIKDWGFQIGHYLEDLVNRPQFVTPEGDEFVLASGLYAVKDNQEVLRRLGKIKSLHEIIGKEEDIKLFSWEKKGRNDISATLEIENDRLRIECYSTSMLEKAKNKIEKELKGLVRHLNDTKKESEAFISKNKDKKDRLSKMPPGARNKKEVDETLDDYYTRWIDQPNPALKGKTPREAAKSTEGRKNLINVLSELEAIYDSAKKRGEPYYNLDKIRKNLNLK